MYPFSSDILCMVEAGDMKSQAVDTKTKSCCRKSDSGVAILHDPFPQCGLAHVQIQIRAAGSIRILRELNAIMNLLVGIFV